MNKLYTLILIICCISAKAQSWEQLPAILNNIQPPTFPSRDINIVNIGAPVNGTSLSTSFIQKAIDSCNGLGGGRVVIPPGTFLTGAITIKSNVNLHISAGATVKFSTNTANYLPVVLTRFEGVECYNYSPFIYAYGAENIAVTGSGTLNGQASNANWWAWKQTGTTDNNLLNTMGENNTPVEERVFGNGHKIRPVFIQFYNSKNILIDSVTIINSPMWEINPVLSENITVQNVVINSHGPNNDGCNPECCKNVLIRKCSFNTGDDCIAIKSGRNNDGRRVNVPSENIVIQNCFMLDGHGGITMGSECSGGIRNVFAEDCTLSSANLNTAFRIKTNSVRGGVIENILLRNCTVNQVAIELLQVDMYYQEGDAGNFTPVVKNIQLENIISNKSLYVFTLKGYQRSPVTDIMLTNCTFNNAGSLGTLTNVQRLQVYNSFMNGAVPLIPAVAQGFTQAEAYSNKLSWGWSNVLAGFTGNGYMEKAGVDNYMEFISTRTKNEMDTMVIRYNNSDTFTKPYAIYINDVPEGQLDFVPTSTAWKTIKKNIALVKGNNIIRIIALNNQPVYLDRFSASFSNDCLCDADTTAFNSGYKGNYIYQWQVYNNDKYEDIYNDEMYSGVNNDTIQLNGITSAMYGKKYRCSINEGSLYSNEFELRFVDSWTGTADTLWENNANWNCAKVPDANTDVIVNNTTINKPVVQSNANCRSLLITSPSAITIKAEVSLMISGKP